MEYHICQLPFPSTLDPDPALAAYYRDYERKFRRVSADYELPEHALWELPLWVAHLTAALDESGISSSFIDLSSAACDVDTIAATLQRATDNRDVIMFSPLAQNLDLCEQVARRLRREGRRVVVGGNMSPLLDPHAADVIVSGVLGAQGFRPVQNALLQVPQRHDLAARRVGGLSSPGLGPPVSLTPNYRHLRAAYADPHMLRLNASHGCLHACDFCGDAWSLQLRTVAVESLREELRQMRTLYPRTGLIYIGDKTFGQSRAGVENLLSLKEELVGLKFIVQTHVLSVNASLISKMKDLGVIVVELGFESADSLALARQGKRSRGLKHYGDIVNQLADAGLWVTLNVMGGLDEETRDAARATNDWLARDDHNAWLFNLYNFVPYPLAPGFPGLRDRIFDWDFARWREDYPVVYHPRHLTAEESWEFFRERVDIAHTSILRHD